MNTENNIARAKALLVLATIMLILNIISNIPTTHAAASYSARATVKTVYTQLIISLSPDSGAHSERSDACRTYPYSGGWDMGDGITCTVIAIATPAYVAVVHPTVVVVPPAVVVPPVVPSPTVDPAPVKSCHNGADNYNRQGKHDCSGDHPDTNSGQVRNTEHVNNGKALGKNK